MEIVWLVCLSVAVGVLLMAAMPPFPRWRFRRTLTHEHEYDHVDAPRYGDNRWRCRCGAQKPEEA